MAAKRICAVVGCGKPYHAHGYCARHAYHFKAHGDPLGGRRGASPGAPLQWIADHADHESDECLRWPFEIGRYGYGTVRSEGKKRVASRVMCEKAHGPAPTPDHEAAHSCGNGHRACMNPKHLSWKARLGNVADSKRHGTWQIGNVRKATVLNPDLVRVIRRLAGTMLQKDIARMIGVSSRNVQRVISGTRWAWVDDGNAELRGTNR